MAGLVLELAEKSNPDLEVKVIPGITASIGAGCCSRCANHA